MDNININRRNFIILGSSLTGSLVLGMPLSVKATDADINDNKLGFFIEITNTGKVIIGNNQPEIGQGCSTVLPMMIAEELDVSWDKVEVVQMPLGLIKTSDGISWKYGGQGGGGSSGTHSNWKFMREIGATARQALVQIAADKWQVKFEQCRTNLGQVLGPDKNQQIEYQKLIHLAAKVNLADIKPQLKDPNNFKLLGKPTNAVSVKDIVTGKAKFGIDTYMPNMKVAVIKRSPYLDGSIKSYDDSDTLKIPGVIKTMEINGPEPGSPYNVLASGIAVIAENTWAAIQGRNALIVKWNHGPHAQESTESFDIHLSDLLKTNGQIIRNDGDFVKAHKNAKVKLSKHYETPYVSHSPLEPQNCYAHVKSDSIHIIVPTQWPSGASRAANAETGIDRMKIKVDISRIGGSFGRRLASDYVAEACIISKQTGLPIKIQWTREDDLAHDFYRPSGLHELTADTDDNGELIAWQYRLASASKYYRRANMAETEYWKADLYDDDYPANIIPNYQLEYHSAQSGMPRGSWRAPGHNANAFAVQSFIDELAYANKQDPLSFQLKLLGEPRDIAYKNYGGPIFNPGRLAKLLKIVAEKIDFHKARKKGTGVGIATHFTFGGYAAHAIEVSVSSQGDLEINKIVGAIDCGFPVNPRGVESQIQGGTIDALSTALNLKITVKDGKVVQSNFHDYSIMRQDMVPEDFEIIIVKNGNTPAAVAEIAIPTVAPALTNAIFAATGKRIRKLPIENQLKS